MRLLQVEDVSAVAKRLRVEIPAEDVARELDKAFQKIGRQANLKGFRPGKAPRSVLERYYGPQVQEEVAQQLIADSAPAALTEAGLKPVVEPRAEAVEFKPKEAFKYSLFVEIVPKIEISDYLGLELARRERAVTEALVSLRLDELRQDHATLEAAPEDHAAAEGDFVLADFEAGREGKPVRSGRLENFDLRLGMNRFHAQVEKALVGLKRGEEITVPAEFPESFFHDALAGQKVELRAKVKDLRLAKIPELSDEFAKGLGAGFETLADLKERLGEQLKRAAANEADRRLQDELLNKLLEKASFPVPEGLVDLELRRMIASLEQSLSQRGLNLQRAGIFQEKLEKDLRNQAVRRVQEDLILSAIAEKEGLAVSDQDYEEALAELAVSLKQDLEQVRKFHREQNLEEAFKAGILKRQTLNRLLTQAKIQTEFIEEEIPPTEAGEPEQKSEA